MTTQPESKSAFRGIALASGFLHEAEKLGLTPTLLQRLRESPGRMKEFIELAKLADEDHAKRIRRLQYEKECAVDIDGTHYHLVPVTKGNLIDWGCMEESLISNVVSVASRHGYMPLREEAYPTAERVLKTLPPSGHWIGWTDYGGLVCWARTDDGVETRGSYGTATGMPLSNFPELRGMVFMQKFVGCDYNPANLT